MEAVHLRGCCQCGLGAVRLKEPQSRATMCRAPIPVLGGQFRQAGGASQIGPANQVSTLLKQAFPRPSMLSEYALLSRRPQPERPSHVIAAAPGDTTARWWEREGGPNVRDVHSIGDFVEELAGAGDKLVVVEFYASWCGSCRALLPKFLKIAAEHPDVTFLKVNFDECKAMCKSLNIKVLPFFHFYRGADGRLDAFSASISKLAKLREAIEIHNTDRCSLGPAIGVGPDFDWEAAAKANAAAAAAAKSAATH